MLTPLLAVVLLPADMLSPAVLLGALGVVLLAMLSLVLIVVALVRRYLRRKRQQVNQK